MPTYEQPRTIDLLHPDERALARLEAESVHLLWMVYESDPIGFIYRMNRIMNVAKERIYDEKLKAS